MTSQGSHGGVQDVCPSCNTRLRISLQGQPRSEFVCPECGLALLARLASNDSVEISAVPTAPLTKPHKQSIISRFPELRLGRSRIIAVVITASVGLLLFILVTPSTEQLQQSTDVAASNLSTGPRTLDNVNTVATVDSTKQGIEVDRPAPDAGIAESNVASPFRNSPEDAVNKSLESNPNARTVTPQQTAPILSELPIDLAISPTRDSQPKLPAGSVQQVAGTEDSRNPDSEKAATIGEPPLVGDVAEIGSPQVPAQPVAKPMNFRSRIEISIRSFRQSKPVPLRDVIRTIETMCRVRVDVSTVPSKLLAAEVTVSLRETTPLEILTEVGRKHGLRAIVGDSSVQLISNPN
jgi:predicted RNA-binding Zn-ribbon protein involved in translation (DUF1610 family)